MNFKNPLGTLLIATLLFTVLFYNKALGINLLIYEIAVVLYLLLTKQLKLKGLNTIVITSAFLLTGILTVVHHSQLSFFVNFLSFVVFIGMLSSPQIRNILHVFSAGFLSFFTSQKVMLRDKLSITTVTGKNFGFRFRRFWLFFAPSMIIIFFITLYGWSNPEFGNFIQHILDFIGDKLSWFFTYVDFAVVFTILTGLLISSFVLIRVRHKKIEEIDAGHSDEMIRVRKEHHQKFKLTALKEEYKATVFMFIGLNIVLIGLNVLDIDHVWLNFQWEGQYLKQFVHRGTYFLLLALVISIILVMYCFRGNLNFYPKNRLLKVLCYIWLAQNLILAISVGIRNWYYIEFFALAYKRIMIVFFLILTIYGLYSVYRKVSQTKSNYYLIRTNAYALFLVLILSSMFNWDRIIARYNFQHSDNSFVHLNFLSELSDTSLPFLDLPLSTLELIDTKQSSKFGYDLQSESSFSLYKRIYLTPNDYKRKIARRKMSFKQRWEKKGWLEWNYSEDRTYDELFSY